MKSEEEKQRQKQLLKEFQQNERQKFIAGLPATPCEFAGLFDFLDEKVDVEGCDDTLKFTEEYLKNSSLDAVIIIPWLKENGGYCDCEVLNNIEEKFENIT